ncbi:hypothetical protein B296_00030965 [Ensete ventricosum]|uniref:Uncharacterized protein n=1 Tax=Ensete ventricosum TaxID=4639 RepID=A0A426Z6U0_ENSVE|nr:hypothetical protein B296_00030965 [Ensete ventricosum]
MRREPDTTGCQQNSEEGEGDRQSKEKRSIHRRSGTGGRQPDREISHLVEERPAIASDIEDAMTKEVGERSTRDRWRILVQIWRQQLRSAQVEFSGREDGRRGRVEYHVTVGDGDNYSWRGSRGRRSNEQGLCVVETTICGMRSGGRAGVGAVVIVITKEDV